MTDRSGVEIDHCPDCRGVWLDRGELDKIIERSSPTGTTTQYDNRAGRQQNPPDRDFRHKKKGGLLGDLFDF